LKGPGKRRERNVGERFQNTNNRNGCGREKIRSRSIVGTLSGESFGSQIHEEKGKRGENLRNLTSTSGS